MTNQQPMSEARTLDAQTVRAVYRGVLGREPESAEVVDRFVNSAQSLETFIRQAVSSAEFASRFNPRHREKAAPDYEFHSGQHYLAPRELQMHGTSISRALLVGSCFFDGWKDALRRGGLPVALDHLHIESHPNVAPVHDPATYDFQLSQIHLRALLPDPVYFNWLRSAFTDIKGCEAVFAQACRSLDTYFERVTAWKDRVPVFLMNFLIPQGSLTPRLLNRFDLSNNVFFTEELNRQLYLRAKHTPNVYYLDADALAASFGRRYVQDDSMWISNHGGLLNNGEVHLDKDRIERMPPPSGHYEFNTEEFIRSLWYEAEAMFRSLRQVDSVKMICVDVDDVLWRGVLADATHIDAAAAVEGWPIAILEALAVLKRRGIILVMVSKNSEENVTRIWQQLYGHKLSLDDFAIRKINWRSKADNIEQVLSEASLLPRNVVFLDDNPVERASVQQAFPQIRAIGSSHYYWKRILLWSAETQPAALTEESTHRTEMIKAQVEREAERRVVPRDQFLRELQLEVKFGVVLNQEDSRFCRALELLNKTNQFNTTGARWTPQTFDAICREGTVMVCEVVDRFTAYGLVLVTIASSSVIEQVAMSCRVVGLDVEVAAVAVVSERLLRTNSVVQAVMRDTDANLLSRSLFERCGWTKVDGHWQTREACRIPAHICLQREVVA